MTPLPLALACIWLGMVVAISIKAPLKFRAPGITLPLGLGIDRRAFRAPEHRGDRARHRAHQ